MGGFGVSIYKAIDIDNGGTTSGYDPVLTVPSATLEGDRMTVVVVTSDNNPSIAPTAPSGWSLEASGSMPIDGTGAVSPAAAWVYGKDASADDETGAGTDTYTWTFSGSEEQCGVLILTEPAAFGQFGKDETSGTHTSIDAPSVTTSVANELVYHCAIKDAGVSFSGFPSGDATRADETFGATSGAGAALGIVEEEYASPGATGTKTFSHANEESNAFTFSLEPLDTEGITSVNPSTFDYDVASININGTNFGASQGSGTVYISDANTLAGSANEVEIAGGINTWSGTQINLDLTGLDSTEKDDLQTLGPGTRYIIVTTNASDEYGSSALTCHRADAFTLSASSNIAAGGEDTTARLTAPSGKSSVTDFDTGRRWDDENGTDAINITEDDYTELEWALEATGNAIDAGDYDFRVVLNDETTLDTYTVTPTWTVSAGASEVALAGSGPVSIAGTGDLSASAGLQGAGPVSTDASAILSAVAAVSGSGPTSTEGSGDVTLLRNIQGSGPIATGASAVLSADAGLSGTGPTATKGNGALDMDTGLSAVGGTATEGTGDFLVSALLSAVGATASEGAGTMQLGTTLSGAGNTATEGTGDLFLQTIWNMESSGDVSVIGSGDLGMDTGLSGTGPTSIGGGGGLSASAPLSGAAGVSTGGSGDLSMTTALSGTGGAASGGSGDMEGGETIKGDTLPLTGVGR